MWADPYFYLTVYLGLCLGSFASALSYRIPRDISIIKKQRSSCPSCNKNLSLVDLIPVFSWVFLKGKCRQCCARIGLRYPLIEIATLLFCVTAYIFYGVTLQTLVLFALAPVIVSIIDIDLHHKIIPDMLNLAVLVAGVFMLFVQPDYSRAALVNGFVSSLSGVLLYGGGALLLRWVFARVMKREPMGLGDVKFFAAAGFWFGLDLDSLATFLMIAGAAGVLLALIWQRISGDREFPFGPALVCAFIFNLFWFMPF